MDISYKIWVKKTIFSEKNLDFTAEQGYTLPSRFTAGQSYTREVCMSRQLIEEILEINKRQTEKFVQTTNDRRAYRALHPTEFLFTLCMDGRINIYALTGLMFGLFNLLRNIGGAYRIGWDLFQTTLEQWEEWCYRMRRHAVVITTYHWSEADKHAGCAGHGYDLLKSIVETQRLRDEIIRCYGGRILSIMMGVETQSEAIILHGERGITIDMREYADNAHEEGLRILITAALPSMPFQVREDLIPILMGNAQHVMELRSSPRHAHQLLHCERVLAIGTALDWLGKLNFALIIGPCDPDRGRAVEKAAAIIWSNWESGRVPNDKDGVLLISVACRDRGKITAATERALETARNAVEILDNIPQMKGLLHPLVGVTDMNTRKFNVLEFPH